jgi:hypothetical protein
MSETALRFTVELLEDLHAGTGLGWLGLLDDTQARDVDGGPVVWATMLRGLLREAADDWLGVLAQAGENVEDRRRRLRKLLGNQGDEQGRAVVRSLRLPERPASPEDYFTVWGATAREVHSRRPDPKTLRFIEYTRAKTVLCGEMRLPAGCDAEDRKFLQGCLHRLQGIGGRKTRGWGQVKVSCDPWRDLPETGNVQGLLAGLALEPADKPVRLRLRLRNLEPLNLPHTAYAGNLIPGLTYLPGGALRGALLTWLDARDQALADGLAGTMGVGNGYVVPGDMKDARWAQVEVMPLPLSVQEPKGGQEAAGSDDVPWWARPKGTDRRLGKDRPERDLIALPRREEEGGPDFKRIKTEEYLLRRPGAAHWERFRPQRGVLLRNQVPTARRDGDNPRVTPRIEGLFSEEMVREDQNIVAELFFGDKKDAEEFVRQATALLGGPVENRSWLRVGRGGRPVVVEDAAWVGPPSAAKGPPADRMTLTLTSDLIARTPWLTFRTDLDLPALEALLREVGEVPPPKEGIKPEAASCEVVEVYAFNRATGLPRSPALAIKRGSVFRWQAESGSGQANLAQWRAVLLRVQARRAGLGERTLDGFGRFVLDLDFHEKDYWASPVPSLSAPGALLQANEREIVLHRVNEFIAANRAELEDGNGRPRASVSQWQWLRVKARTARDQDDLRRLHQDLAAHAGRLAGRKQWGERLPRLLASAESEAAGAMPDNPLEARKSFLEELARAMTARARAARRREGERQ